MEAVLFLRLSIPTVLLVNIQLVRFLSASSSFSTVLLFVEQWFHVTKLNLTQPQGHVGMAVLLSRSYCWQVDTMMFWIRFSDEDALAKVLSNLMNHCLA